jgi:hypothetical protein
MPTFNKYKFYGAYQLRFAMLVQRIFVGIFIIACATKSMAQTTDSQQKEKHFAIYAGIGPNYYFNNLQVGHDFVNEFNYSIVGRFMWEPGHFLSIGVESGYYRLYTLNAPAPAQVHISNTAIPIQIVVSMKFLKAFYGSLSMGQSILKNDDHSATYGDFSTHAVSLADFTGTVGYRHMLTNKFSIGTEAKYFYSSSFTDKNIALVFVGGFRF